MESDKQKIAEGIRFLAVALPLVFSGPALYVGIGIAALRGGNYLWIGISIFVMLVAVFLMVKGLRRILSGFFND